MARVLRIALFGHDTYAHAAVKTFMELMRMSNYKNEYYAILPQNIMQPHKDAPCRSYNLYVKQNADCMEHKVVRSDWKTLQAYLSKRSPHYGLVFPLPNFDPSIRTCFLHNLFLAHPSLLPSYASPDAISQQLFYSESKAGVTITQVFPTTELYSNHLYAQEEFPIEAQDSYLTLSSRLGQKAGLLLKKLICNFEEGRESDLHPCQNSPLVMPHLDRTFAADSHTAEHVVKLFRATEGSNYPPITMLKRFGELLMASFVDPQILRDLQRVETWPLVPPGTLAWNFFIDPEALFIKCKEGWLRCGGIRIIRPKAVSRGVAARYFVNAHVLEPKSKQKPKVGTALVFDTSLALASLEPYKRLVDKKFSYIYSV